MSETTNLPTVKTPEEVQEGHGLFELMGRDGDTKHTWDPKNKDQVAAAKALFETLQSKGQRVFKLGRFGGKGEVMTEFDPNAGRLLAVPPLAGG